MRFATRAAALAAITALTAAVVLFRPGAEPVAVAAAVPAAQPAAGGAGDSDLALVPADAVAFIHVRAADLWKNDLFADFRKTFQMAGPKALAALDEQFVPKISTFDRFTAFFIRHEFSIQPIVVLRFSAPFDPDEVVKAYIPDAKKVTANGKTVYTGRGEFAMHFPDKQHIVLGPDVALDAYVRHPFPKTGAMSYGLKLAASGKPVVGSVNLAVLPIPPKFLEGVPPDVKALLKAEHVTASLDLGAEATVQLTAGYKNADDSMAAEKAVKSLAEFARKELATVKEDMEKKILTAKGPRPAGDLPEAVLTVFALGAINQLDGMLANPGKYVKRDGANLTATITLPKELIAAVGSFAAVGVGLLLPAVQKVRESAARMSSMNNLKQIALAIHIYHDANGCLPRDITDKNGKPLLSWRVAILPYIEQQNLYQQFKLDEPWDSENNKKWSQIAVKTYMSPLTDTPPGKTTYQGFVGPGTVFEPGKKLTLGVISNADGTSNTIMVVETADMVEWAKPGGIPFDPKKPLPKLTSAGGNNLIQALLCDGSVRSINLKTISEKTLKNAIQWNDGNELGNDW